MRLFLFCLPLRCEAFLCRSALILPTRWPCVKGIPILWLCARHLNSTGIWFLQNIYFILASICFAVDVNMLTSALPAPTHPPCLHVFCCLCEIAIDERHLKLWKGSLFIWFFIYCYWVYWIYTDLLWVLRDATQLKLFFLVSS